MSANIFTQEHDEVLQAQAPLAVRVRPTSFDNYFGQTQAVGKGSWLRSAIENDSLSSTILFGPAGTGKTTLARIIAKMTHATFVEVSAIAGSVKDLRKTIDEAKSRLLVSGRRTILFIDEIHRFNRAQQDALLHAVEDRVLILVGATTENPYFEVNSALLSRCRVVELKLLSDSDIVSIIEHALTCPEGLKGRFELDAEARDSLVMLSSGDARSALTTLELAADLAQKRSAAAVAAEVCASDAASSSRNIQPCIVIHKDDIKDATPSRYQRYDKNADEHYDIVSAFIKSMRGSDPDASVYYLARMLAAGEDPKFIARRIFILASEDIGNADPQAILVAHAAFKACEVIGLPECRINLAQAAVYMALAPKSNASYMALEAALRDIEKAGSRPVPNYLRDRHRPGSENYGAYLYPHNFPSHWVEQRYLPEGLDKGCFYASSDTGWESYRSHFSDHDIDKQLFMRDIDDEPDTGV